jgi:hypothetical protein
VNGGPKQGALLGEEFGQRGVVIEKTCELFQSFFGKSVLKMTDLEVLCNNPAA